jgi:dipeptidyl aminopeptidase/acylaminoacyl peptidase
MAQPFDLDRVSITGEAVAVAADIGATSTGYAAFSASHTGVIVHAKNIGLPGELRWFDRSGSSAESIGTPAEHLDFELSPDEQTVAISKVDPKLKSADVHLLNLARNNLERFTLDPMNDASALWSPDGGRIVFRSNRHGTTVLYQKRLGATETEQPMLKEGTNLISSDWSVDGKWIVYTETSSTAGFNIWVWPTDGHAKPQHAVQTANAMHGRERTMAGLRVRRIGGAAGVCPAVSSHRGKAADLARWWIRAAMAARWQRALLSFVQQQVDERPNTWRQRVRLRCA